MNDDENRKLLEKQEETLTLVRKIWRAEKWRRFWTILRYVIFIGIIFGAFYFLTPYIERVMSVAQQFKGVTDSSVDLQKILDQVKLFK